MTTTTRRPAARIGKPVIDPAGWVGHDLRATNEWIHQLSDAEIDSLREMARAVRHSVGDDLTRLLAMDRNAFNLGAFDDPMRRVYAQLKDGLGVMLIRGLPLDDMDLSEAAIIYWAMGRHLGIARSNNPEGDMLAHITDLGRTQKDPKSRGYQTREAMDYHCDQTSIVGLLCMREAQSGGLSKIASSVSVYNELLRRSPSSVQRLAEPMYWTKHGEMNPDEPPFYQSAVLSILDDMLCTSYGPNHIAKGHALPGAPALTDEQRAAIDLFREIAEEQHHAMELKRGDIQFLNNYVALHTRTAYVDWPEPARKRLLWRLWLSTPDLRPPTAYVQQWDAGVVLSHTRARILLEGAAESA